MVKGTKNADVLDIKFGDTVTAYGSADTINVVEANPYFGETVTPYGLIDGGAGIDTLVLKAPVDSNDWTYTFSDVRSVEKLTFTSTAPWYARADFQVTVPLAKTGTVAVGKPLAITGSIGGNEVVYTVTGGMGSASAITLPNLTFVDFAPSAPLATRFSDDFVELRAGDSSNYVLQASNAIGRLGIEQDLFGNAGNDTLIGSVGSDYLGGGLGADKLYGKGGDDVLIAGGSEPPVAGDLFDGGSGVDFLYVYGGSGGSLDPIVPITFAGTLVSIEGIQIGYRTELLITADQMAMLPAALKISGGFRSPASALHITDASKFSAAKFAFLGATAPKIVISGTNGADIIIGSSGKDVLHGSDGADRLIGGAGADLLYGDGGADTLTGGLGGDVFVFTSVAKPVARDTITDFNSAEADHIALSLTGFTEIHQTDGFLNANEFYAAAGAKAAHDADDRIIYNTANGVLSYDADGLGGQAAVIFAVVKNQPALVAADIMITADIIIL